uniref:Retrovirus-related Pol polyprotein from transposon TNT 1-94 n=1 Tax=Tanacetum cinerariifolium TaxID=118510 RepID=A0A699GS06_TANCI|nr:hypothetical protein [Tanacetum cinerariifolium]
MEILREPTLNKLLDFQDSLDDEEDTRSSKEYMNDFEKEYQAITLLAKSKRVILQETDGQRHQFLFISHLFNQNFSIHLSKNLNRGIPKTLKASTTKSKAKLALVGSSTSASSSSSSKNKGLIAKTYNSDEEEVSSNDNEVIKVKALMALTDEERVYVDKENNSEVSITSSNKPKLSEDEDSTLSNHDTGKVPSNESLRNTTGHSVVVSDSSMTDYDSVDEYLVCSIPLPPLEKLTGDEPVSRPKTIKLILNLKSTFKAETLKAS